jgi:hypothetical protein
MTEQPGPPNGTRHLCPLQTTCSWRLDIAPAPVFAQDAFAGVFDFGEMNAIAFAQHTTKIERALTEHLATHSTIEFVTEIAKLRELSIGLTEQLVEMGQLYQAAAARNEA